MAQDKLYKWKNMKDEKHILLELDTSKQSTNHPYIQ